MGWRRQLRTPNQADYGSTNGRWRQESAHKGPVPGDLGVGSQAGVSDLQDGSAVRKGPGSEGLRRRALPRGCAKKTWGWFQKVPDSCP